MHGCTDAPDARMQVGGTLLLRTDHRHLRLFHSVAGLALCGWHVWVVTCGNFRKHGAAWLNFQLLSGKLESRRIILMPGHVIYLRFFQARNWEWAVYCNTFWDNKKLIHLKPDETSPSVSHTRDCMIVPYPYIYISIQLSSGVCHVSHVISDFTAMSSCKKKNARRSCALWLRQMGKKAPEEPGSPRPFFGDALHREHSSLIYTYTDTEAWDYIYIYMYVMSVCITTYIELYIYIYMYVNKHTHTSLSLSLCMYIYVCVCNIV